MIEGIRPAPSTEKAANDEVRELERKLLQGVKSRRDFGNATEKAREIGYVAERINTLFDIAFKEAPEGMDVSPLTSEAAAAANEALAADNFGSSSQDGKIQVLKNLIKYRQSKGSETAPLEEEIDKALLKEVEGHYASSGNRRSAVRELRDRYIERRDYDAAIELAGRLEPAEKIEILEPLLERFAKNGTNRDTASLTEELNTLREQVRNEPIKDSESRQVDSRKIWRALSQSGLEKSEAAAQALDVAKQIRLFERSSEANQAEALHPIVSTQVEAGLLDDALETAKKIRRESVRSRAIGTVAEAFMKAGDFDTMYKLIEQIPYKSEYHWYSLAREYANRGIFDKALETARIHNGSYAYLDIAKAQQAAGIDPVPTLQEAIQKCRDDVARIPNWSDLRAHNMLEIAEYERELGIDPSSLIQEAKEMYGDKVRPRDLAHIAKLESQAAAFSEEDRGKLQRFVPTLLKQGRDDVAYAIGFIAPETASSVNEIPAHMRRALELGEAESQKNMQAVVETSNAVDSDADDAEKRALSRSLRFQDYAAVSNELLRKFDAEKDFTNTVRYLKTLIEIENPKGRTFATKLYANPDLPARQKEYLARKLIDEGHWDKKLGELLGERIERGTSKTEIDAVLTKIINDLNLTPDETVYKLLETQGLLKEPTLDGRVAEIARRKEEFTRFNRDELLSLFKEDRDAIELYYVFFGGESSYSLINDYTFNKFRTVVDEINELEIDNKRMDEFSEALKSAGKSDSEIKAIRSDLLAGRFPIVGDNRTFSFESAVEIGSEYAEALNRLQETWSGELKRILVLVANGKSPENMTEVDGLYKDEMLADLSEKPDKQSRKTSEILKTYGIGQKQDRKSMLAHSERMRKELLQRARQQKNKEERARLETLPASHVISEYFSTLGAQQLQNCGAYTEWSSHISEVLTTLEQGEQRERSTGERGRNVQVDATFLDKGKDFIRAIRFADGRQCCFNSGNYEGGGAAKWIARLNRDPLSFVIDIKEKDANDISGFVFGRIGIDPEKKTPIVMLNGVYSRITGAVFVDNLLGLIEEKFAQQIGASEVVLASKYGGSLTKVPTGYSETDDREIVAIRALEDERRVYDDIGDTANGKFRFKGYRKNLG